MVSSIDAILWSSYACYGRLEAELSDCGLCEVSEEEQLMTEKLMPTVPSDVCELCEERKATRKLTLTEMDGTLRDYIRFCDKCDKREAADLLS